MKFLQSQLLNPSSVIFRILIKLFQFPVTIFLPSRILSGPFKGAYVEKNWFGSALLPKIIGTYELEVSERIFSILKHRNIDAVIDLGCAGGYYLSIALSLKKGIKYFGIDTNKRVHKSINRLSEKYGVEIEFLNQRASSKDLYHFATKFKSPFFIIDIEGSEYSLFQGVNTSLLKDSTFFIELHETKFDVCNTVLVSLSQTHVCEIFSFDNYGIKNVSSISLKEALLLFIRHEMRNPLTKYLIASPRENALYGM